MAPLDELAQCRRARLGAHAAGQLLVATAAALSGAVVLLDVDRMGDLNRRAGVQVGDLLLAQIETAIQEAIRGRGGATSFGGDQFLAVVTGDHRPGAVVRRLRRAVRQVRVGRAHVTASAGICCWTGERPPAGALLAAASVSLELAKRR